MSLLRAVFLLSLYGLLGGGSLFCWADEEANSAPDAAAVSSDLENPATSSLDAVTPAGASFEEKWKVAQSYYEKGNCAAALPLFGEIRMEATASAAILDDALYRKAYCDFTLGNVSEAFEGFSAYLAKYPSHVEARLKAGESAYYAGSPDKALSLLRAVNTKPFSGEARLLEARIAIDRGQGGEALKRLRLAAIEGVNSAVYLYWRGVAEYGTGDLERAAKTFEAAIRTSAPEQWTIAASKGWLERLEEDGRWWHYRMGVGLFFDGNTAQSATLSFTGTGGPTNSGSGGSGGAPRTGQLNTVYPVDRGLLLEPSADFSLWRRKSDALTFSMSGYGTIYQKTPTSTFTSLTARLDYSRFDGGSTRSGISAAYQDMRIRYLYFQDFFVLTPYASGRLFGSLSWNFSLPATIYVVTQSGYILGPTLGVGASLWKLYVSGGLSGTFSRGPKAVYKTSPSSPGSLPYVSSGVLFSHFLAYGPYVSVSAPFLFGLDLNATLTQTTTQYEAEDFPGGIRPPEGPRKDFGLNLAVNATKVLIPARMWVTVTGTYLSNQSSGFSGFFDGASGAGKPTFTYSRPYLIVSLTTAY